MIAHLISQLEVKVLQQGSHSGHQADLGQRLAHARAGALREWEVALRPLALACRGRYQIRTAWLLQVIIALCNPGKNQKGWCLAGRVAKEATQES